MKLSNKEAGGHPMPFKDTFALYNYRTRSCVVTWGSTFAALNSQVSLQQTYVTAAISGTEYSGK